MIHDMIMAAAGASGPAASSDADFENTVLLLHGDGTNGAQNNTFLDSSTNNFTITRNGNTTQGTFSPFSKVDGRWGNYFDGNGDYLSASSNTAFAYGTGDFTFDVWVYRSVNGVQHEVFNCMISGAFIVYINTSNKAVVRSFGTADLLISSGDVLANGWNHIAVARSGTTLSMWINGSRSSGGTTTDSTNFTQNGMRIGVNGVGAAPFEGYISNLRSIKGSALYDPTQTTITVPTAPLTAVSNTQLLTCQSNRFIDNSSNNFTITRNGDVSVTPFSPFPITTAYDPAVNGGSGYFDGTGDYLTAPNDSALAMGSGDFEISFWVYHTSSSASYTYIDTRPSGTNGAYITIGYSAPDLFVVVNGSFLVDAAVTPAIGAWSYITVSRVSGTTRLFLNGTERDSAADTTTYLIGAQGMGIVTNTINSNGPWPGYLSGLRVVKGSGVTSVTVPTAPPTAIANTSLLLNFTNAGIFDNTGFNNLETVGNAQIDTTTKKYGTGSIEFDGTGDWLLMPNTPDQQLGTGNFTIEFWVYLASGDTGSNRGLVAKGTSTTGFLVSLNTTEKVVFTYATSTITSSGAITTNAWNHIAVVREGTGSNQTKIYIGGTNDGTGTVSTDFNQTSVMYVGANRTGGDPMKGFIDDLRITKGIARYTSNFTPPTAALPDIGT